MHIPGSELLPSLTPNGQKTPGRTYISSASSSVPLAPASFLASHQDQVSQGPRSVRLAEKTVGPMLLQFLCLCVISSKPVSWGGTWWYMILDHTHLRFCLKSHKMRAASVEFRGVNEKDHCVQQFNRSKLPLLPFQNNLHVYSLVRDTELECIDVHMWGRSLPADPSIHDAPAAANSEALGLPTPVSLKRASFCNVPKIKTQGIKIMDKVKTTMGSL